MISKPLTLASLSVLLVAGLGIWGWSLHPERAARWAFVMFALPALWGFIELAMRSRADLAQREAAAILNWHRSVIAGAALWVAVGEAFQIAVSAELLHADWAPIGSRIKGILFGIGMVLWGNYLPKGLSPWSVADEPFDWQRVHRFVGWVASLGGVALVTVQLALPLEQARLAMFGIIATVCVLMGGRKLMSVVAYSRRQPPPTPPQTDQKNDVRSVPL